MISKPLRLALKREYFNDIRSGVKTEEYRLYNDYWKKRLEGKSFSGIVLTLGYPNKDDHDRHIYRHWRGYEVKEILHPEFGDKPVKVFAITLVSNSN